MLEAPLPKLMSENNPLQPSLFEDVTPSEGADNETSLLALASIRGVGFVTALALFNGFGGDLTRVWTADAGEVMKHLQSARTPQPTEVLEQMRRRQKDLLITARDLYRHLQERRHVSLVFRGSERFPKRLNDLPTPPAWLFIEGDPELLHQENVIAVVGTRKPSKGGVEASKRLAVHLAQNDVVILSGLAEGIDAVAHQAAVDFRVPTVAVLGHGFEVVFPAGTAGLRQEIVKSGGAVISEYLPNDSYTRDRFVHRNRLQAALSAAVGVVEGESRSGTAHTVRFARQLGRGLFGVCLGEVGQEPLHGLLTDLKQNGYPVFDLSGSDGTAALTAFIQSRLDLKNAGRQVGRKKPFNNLVREIERLADYYDASEGDFHWLSREIGKIRRGRKEDGTRDAN